MQDLQPMHRSPLKSTIPLSRLKRAVTGQMVMHGASSQWLHRSTEKNRRVSGYSPFSMYLTQVRNVPSGTSFSDLQATVQAWQPMHFRWSMTKPYFIWWKCYFWAKRRDTTQIIVQSPARHYGASFGKEFRSPSMRSRYTQSVEHSIGHL